MFQNVASWLLDDAGLSPHGFCLLWEPGLIWLHALSDLGIALAYYTIPIPLLVLSWRRRDLVFRPLFWLFATFILLCGTTHVLGIVTLFTPAYWLEGLIKAATAAVSLVTAVIVWLIIPDALTLPSPKQMEALVAALKASEARHRSDFEAAPVPMQVANELGVLTTVSNSWLAMLGYERGEVIGRNAADFLAEPAAGPPPPMQPREQRLRRKDGSEIITEITTRIDQTGEQVRLISAIVDITARRRAEAALKASEDHLHQVQKMEAVGQLSGGLAHDLNNMLQGLSSSLEMFQLRADQGRPDLAARYVAPMRQSLTRAAALTQRLLAFARRQTLAPKQTDVDALLLGFEELLRRTVGPAIALELRHGTDHSFAWCDPNQLESAVLNLVINARDAMPEGGSLRIERGSRTLTATEAGGELELQPGTYVQISVSDTGVGMTEEVKARAFEPFFTTKPLGEGTGLGLSQIHGFAHQSGGAVEIESAPGRGTTVSILLPRAAPPRRMADGLPTRTETGQSDTPVRAAVLLVDDEDTVRETVAERLREAGMWVTTASDSGAALRMIEQGLDLDLLVSDVGMPGMNGRQLAEAARAARPGLPVILVTGYAGSALRDEPLPPGFHVLPKPFALDDLLAAVRAGLQLPAL